MMLHSHHFLSLKRWLLVARVCSRPNSSDVVQIVQWVLTRTLSRLSVTTQINTVRHISLTTLRSQEVSLVHTFVSVTLLSVQHIWLTHLTSLLVTYRHTSTCMMLHVVFRRTVHSC